MADVSLVPPGLLPAVSANVILITIVGMLALFFGTIILGLGVYWFYNMISHNIPVFIIREDMGMSIVKRDKGRLLIKRKERETKFTLYSKNMEIPNIDSVQDFIGGYSFLVQFGDLQFAPIRLNLSELSFKPHLVSDILWFKMAAKREIEKRMKGSWLEQNWPQLIGLVIIIIGIATLWVFATQLGKLENLGPSIDSGLHAVADSLKQQAAARPPG